MVVIEAPVDEGREHPVAGYVDPLFQKEVAVLVEDVPGKGGSYGKLPRRKPLTKSVESLRRALKTQATRKKAAEDFFCGFLF